MFEEKELYTFVYEKLKDDIPVKILNIILKNYLQYFDEAFDYHGMLNFQTFSSSIEEYFITQLIEDLLIKDKKSADRLNWPIKGKYEFVFRSVIDRLTSIRQYFEHTTINNIVNKEASDIINFFADRNKRKYKEGYIEQIVVKKYVEEKKFSNTVGSKNYLQQLLDNGKYVTEKIDVKKEFDLDASKRDIFYVFFGCVSFVLDKIFYNIVGSGYLYVEKLFMRYIKNYKLYSKITRAQIKAQYGNTIGEEDDKTIKNFMKENDVIIV